MIKTLLAPSLDLSDIWKYMIEEVDFGTLVDVASSATGRNFLNCDDEESLYVELDNRGFLRFFIERFGAHYDNRYGSNYYGFCNSLISDLENLTGRDYGM